MKFIRQKIRKLFHLLLKITASRVIKRYRPVVVGVTGSVGKTTAKEAIFSVLSRKFWVRKNEENYNNEVGVPLAVLGVKPISPQNKKGDFLLSLLKSAWLAYGWPEQAYPRLLILELAADRPGDIEYLSKIINPKIGVVTAVGDVPVHVEFYASPEAVAKEKSKLVAALPPDGLAVLNYDDQAVLDMKEKTSAKKITFGFSNSADLWASDTSYFAAEESLSDGVANQNIGGLSFKINSGSTFVPMRANNLVAIHQIYGILAAAAVGLHFGMNLVDISGAIENIDLPHRRMNLLRGVKNSVVIDDTYNASPLSTHAALDTLRDFTKARQTIGKNGRRIAVLGDMRELGKYEANAHRAIGNLAAERCDILVTVGGAGKLIADSAGNQMPKENIISFDTSEEAKIRVQEIIREGDVVLVKGSRAMKMEKIVEEIAAA